MILTRRKAKSVQVYKINKPHIYHLLIANINLAINLKISYQFRYDLETII